MLDLTAGQRFKAHIKIHSKMVKWTRRPSQSPDLKPIENLWVELKRRVHKRRHRTLPNLERLCIEDRSKNLFLCVLKLHKIVSDYDTRFLAKNKLSCGFNIFSLFTKQWQHLINSKGHFSLFNHKGANNSGRHCISYSIVFIITYMQLQCL